MDVWLSRLTRGTNLCKDSTNDLSPPPHVSGESLTYGRVCTSTLSTDGRLLAIARQWSPPSGEQYT